MSRFSDKIELVSRAEYVPATALALLSHLHLEDAPKPHQEGAIRDWLKTHAVGRAMAFTLRNEGYGHLLDERVTASVRLI